MKEVFKVVLLITFLALLFSPFIIIMVVDHTIMLQVLEEKTSLRCRLFTADVILCFGVILCILIQTVYEWIDKHMDK